MAPLASTNTIDMLPGPRGLPLIGSAHRIKADRLHLTLEQWAERYGETYRFKLGRREVVVTADAQAIGAMLRDRPEGFRRWSAIEQIFGEMQINGVFSAEGEDWRRQRRLAVRALNTNHLNSYFDVIRTSVERLHEKWLDAARTGAEIDIQRDFMSFTVDVTSSLAFGHDLNTIERPDSELQGHVESIFPMIARRISAPFAYWKWVKLPSDRACERSLRFVRVAADSFVAQARERLERRPELRAAPTNFLESMLVAHEEDESSYSEDEIFGNTFTMLLAGEDTTANTMAWTTWFLAQQAEVFERVRDESDRLLAGGALPSEYATAADASYLEAVINESMRLKPVAPVLFIEALKDTSLNGTKLPAGSRVIALPRYAATRERNFSRPESFDPERWIHAAAAEGDD
ncbi:MAG: cytochrome P450, partial [Solirubrobacterales bacterium]